MAVKEGICHLFIVYTLMGLVQLWTSDYFISVSLEINFTRVGRMLNWYSPAVDIMPQPVCFVCH